MSCDTNQLIKILKTAGIVDLSSVAHSEYNNTFVHTLIIPLHCIIYASLSQVCQTLRLSCWDWGLFITNDFVIPLMIMVRSEKLSSCCGWVLMCM